MEARELIVEADRIRQDQNLSQAEWSRAAGLDEYGMCVTRAFSKGNCKLTVLTSLLRPLGYGLKIERLKDREGV